jgi:hypothetical protein
MPPHLQQQYGCVLDRDYPLPLVDIHLAAQYAKQQVSAVHREIKDTLAYRSILERHASRKGQHFTSRNTTGSETMKKTRVSGPVKHFKQQQMNLFDGYQDRE